MWDIRAENLSIDELDNTDTYNAGGMIKPSSELAGTQTALPTYRLMDHLGSLVMQTNSSGTVTGSNVFRPFGDVLSSTTTDSFQFTGLPQDTENSSYHATYRNLSTTRSRWLSPDPYNGSYDITNPQSFNRYVYASNNPLAFTDPSGLYVAECNTAEIVAGCASKLWGDGVPYQGFGDEFSIIEIAITPTGGGLPYSLNGDGIANTPLVYGNIGALSTIGLLQPPISGPIAPNNGTSKQKQCEANVQSAVDSNLGTQSIDLGASQGMDANGMRGGAYNFNFFAPGIAFQMPPGPGSVPGTNCGRFGGGLHIPVPYGPCNLSGDPTISNWGPGVYNGVSGSFFTAHIDSADPFQDVWSFFVHLIENVILQKQHGC